jgi:hypothetical protein
LIRRRRVLEHPLFAAATVVAIAYTNVAFSRADANHLAQAIAPTLMALMVVPELSTISEGKYRQAAATTLLILGCVSAVPIHPRYQAYQAGNWQRLQVIGHHFWVDLATAEQIRSIEEVRRREGLMHDSVLAVPMTPGLNAMLEQRSQLWEIYALFPRNTSFQQREINRLTANPPRLVVISVTPLDGRPELSYPVTHALIYRYIKEHYRRVDAPQGSLDLEFYVGPDGARAQP